MAILAQAAVVTAVKTKKPNRIEAQSDTNPNPWRAMPSSTPRGCRVAVHILLDGPSVAACLTDQVDRAFGHKSDAPASSAASAAIQGTRGRLGCGWATRVAPPKRRTRTASSIHSEWLRRLQCMVVIAPRPPLSPSPAGAPPMGVWAPENTQGPGTPWSPNA